MLTKSFSRISWLILLTTLLAGGCVSRSAQRGIAVDTLRPIRMEQGSLCGEVAVIRARLDLAPAVQKTLNEGQQRQILAMARAKFEQVGFLRHTDAISASFTQPYHDLIIRINELNVLPDQRAGKLTQRTVQISLAANLEKDLVGCYTARPYTKDETRQAVSENVSKLPTQKQLTTQAINKALDRVIRQFAPKKVKTFRPVRASTGIAGKVAALLDNGNCSLAMEVAENELAARNKDIRLSYHAGVAAECLASRNIKRQAKAMLLSKARKHYATVLLDSPKDTDTARAMREVERQLYYLNLTQEHEDRAKQQLNDSNDVNVY